MDPRLLVALLLAAAPVAPGISDPALTNQVLRIAASPQLAPGQAGELVVLLHNPYNASMASASLRAEVYRYVTNGGPRAVDGSFPAPAFQASGGPVVEVAVPDLAPGATARLPLGLSTTPAVAHGGPFDEGTYLVRFRLDVDLLGGRRLLVSLGFFTPEEWRTARAPPPPGTDPSCLLGEVNYCYLGGLLGRPRIDGLLPDAAFGVREPLPRWPFYLLAAASGLLGLAALGAWVLEHPGRFPRLEGPLRRLLRRPPAKPL